jgi:hypothetical protein
MSIEVLLNDPQISVIGPPETINLQVEVGPRGQRGSQIYSGFDDPNITPPNSSALVNDIFIRESQGQTEGYIYQYLSDGIGGFQWELIGTLKPSTYSEVLNISPIDGEYTYRVSLANAFSNYSVSEILAENISVQVSLQIEESSKTLISNINLKEIDTLTNDFVVVFNVLEYSLGSWSESEDENIYFNISLSLIA